jgi:ABC-type dipeptide/oligopeptide/nickel transport system ATPase component
MEGGSIVEEGKPSEILVNPKEPRTQQFLKRITDPQAAGEE